MRNLDEICFHCGKTISSEEFVENGGMCKECMESKELEEQLNNMGLTNNTEDGSKYRGKSSNTVASIIKVIAIVEGILGVIAAFFMEDYIFAFIVVSIISAIFTYAIGEVITLLQTIVDNTYKK